MTTELFDPDLRVLELDGSNGTQKAVSSCLLDTRSATWSRPSKKPWHSRPNQSSEGRTDPYRATMCSLLRGLSGTWEEASWSTNFGLLTVGSESSSDQGITG